MPAVFPAITSKNWFLDRQMSSKQLLHFYYGRGEKFISTGSLPEDTLRQNPELSVGSRDRKEFGIQFKHEALRGKFSAIEKAQTLTLDLYAPGETDGDEIDDSWKKYDTRRYRVVQFTRRKLVLATQR